MMPRTWKSALAPFLAGIRERPASSAKAASASSTICAGAKRHCPAWSTAAPRWHCRKAPPRRRTGRCRSSRCGRTNRAWRQRLGLSEGRPVVAFAPGAVGPSKRWRRIMLSPPSSSSTKDFRSGWWAVPGKSRLPPRSPPALPTRPRPHRADLRNAILALAAADVALSNDSGLLHVAAALGTQAVGIFGPTSPWHWAPLNPMAAVIETETEVACRPCHKPICRLGHHRCMREISPTGSRGGEKALALTRPMRVAAPAAKATTGATSPSRLPDPVAAHFQRSLETLKAAAEDAEFRATIADIARQITAAFRQAASCCWPAMAAAPPTPSTSPASSCRVCASTATRCRRSR